MSWHFSRALAEAYSAANSSAGAACAPSSSTHTPAPSSPRGKMTVASRLSRYGTMFGHLTGDRGEAVLMSFLADFPVRTSPAPGNAQASPESAAASGPKWPELSEMCVLGMSSSKTHKNWFGVALDKSCTTFPQWGTMRDGVWWELTTPELLTKGTVSGSWPTPDKRDSKPEGYAAGLRRLEKYSTCGLETAVRLRSGGVVGGHLSPDWCEWLMGWPIGWSELSASGTDKFQQWCDSHGITSEGSTMSANRGLSNADGYQSGYHGKATEVSK